MKLKYKDIVAVDATEYTIIGIFDYLKQLGTLTFLTENETIILDEGYYIHSGEKTINKTFIDLKERFNLTDTQLKTFILNKTSSIVNLTFGKKWERLFQVLNTQYSVLDNFKYDETTNIDTTSKETQNNSTTSKQSTNSKITSTDSETSKDGSYGFNSPTSVPVDDSENTSISTTQGLKDDNYTDTTSDEDKDINKDINIDKTITKSGKEGNSDYQDIIKKELELRKYNIYCTIFNDIDSILCQKIYDF